MFSRKQRFATALAALPLAVSLAGIAQAAPADKPVAGKQVRFEHGYWSGLPQLGPDGKVRQCVMVALRQRRSGDRAVDTRFAVNVSRGAGLVFTVNDDGLPREHVLDDQAEIVIDGRSFPAVGFNIGPAFAFHPGDAAGAMAAVAGATRVTLRSDGAGLDTGAVTIPGPGSP